MEEMLWVTHSRDKIYWSCECRMEIRDEERGNINRKSEDGSSVKPCLNCISVLDF